MSPERPITTAKLRLLTGGNPQIAKGYGDAPVQAWLSGAQGWKQITARQIDAIVTATLPGVEKAVKYSQPFYGVERGRWFLGMHIMTRYLKLAFFDGADLDPVPPVASKVPRVRYWHLHEGEAVDEAQLVDWVRQAAHLPGEKL